MDRISDQRAARGVRIPVIVILFATLILTASLVLFSGDEASAQEQPQELRKPVPASDRDLARIAASYRGSARSRGCTYC